MLSVGQQNVFARRTFCFWALRKIPSVAQQSLFALSGKRRATHRIFFRAVEENVITFLHKPYSQEPIPLNFITSLFLLFPVDYAFLPSTR
ncbi:hypothetical protein [uncultured Treponema sp.]|uniref:hypothetical protein n=1 Tax=uncultured Treponema sp. TaxID=162155 RepID=UPI0025ECAE64|nr:hypothetical protein [uncultured Treponema sp.]